MTDYASNTNAELDALCARAMGWELRAAPGRALSDPGSGRCSWFDGDEEICDVRDWSPTTPSAATFEVIDRVKRDGVVLIEVGEPRVGMTRVTIMTDPSAPGGAVTRGEAIDAEPARAIVIAALEASEAGKVGAGEREDASHG